MVDGISGGAFPGPGIARGKLPAPTAANQPARLEPQAPGRAAAAGRVDAPAVETRVSGLVREMAAQPPVDSSRVAALKASLADGSYRLDADRTAAAMISQEALALRKG